MNHTIRVVVAEDHPFFREGLLLALRGASGIEVVGDCGDGSTALDLIRTREPDVAIVDVGLPQLDGCELVRRLRADRLPVEVIFLTIADDPDIFEHALTLGVKGYLLKDCTAHEIVRCIEAVVKGQHCASPAMTTHIVNRIQRVRQFAKTMPGLELLTPQERAVLRAVAQGRRSKEIAEALDIAPKTVDAHRTNVCRKLGLHGNHALKRFAAEHQKEI